MVMLSCFRDDICSSIIFGHPYMLFFAIARLQEMQYKNLISLAFHSVLDHAYVDTR